MIDILINDLLIDPDKFVSQGKGHQLLKEIYHNENLDSVLILSKNSNSDIRRVATFVLSELGLRGIKLVDYSPELVFDEDVHTRYYFLDLVFLDFFHFKKSVNLLNSFMSDENEFIKQRAIELFNSV